MLARTIPVNIHYRCTGHELQHMFRDGRLAAPVVDAEHAPLAATAASSCPALRRVLVTGGEPDAASFPSRLKVAG